MGSWHSYPKIFALGHKYLQMLLTGEVIVQEKIDGSQFSFCRLEGDRLVVRSRGMEQDINDGNMFAPIIEYVKSIKPLLVEGWTYRGEFLSKPKHNTLCYDRIPKNFFICFDIEIEDQHYLPMPAVEKEAERLGFETVPILYSGPAKNLDREILRRYLDRSSVLGAVKIEGVVVKNYERFGEDKKALFGKVVSDDFKEAHGNSWTERNPCPTDFYAQLGQNFCTTARWQKALQRLKEAGKWTQSLSDIGPLLNEIKQDVMIECGQEIKDALFAHAWKSIAKQLVVGFPQWYKEELVKLQFEKVAA